MAGRVRPARAGEVEGLGPLYARANFKPHLARTAALARDTLGGEAFVAELDGEVVGASACAHFGATGWVGAVAVLPERRGAGLGGALTEAAISWLRDRGAGTVLLYATELGRPVYDRLGFTAEGTCVTLGGGVPVADGDGPAPARVRAAGAEDLEAAVALDRAATGEDRYALLAAFWSGGALVAEAGGAVSGFHLPSPWRAGGAMVAADLDAGLALLEAARRRAPGGRLDVSVPDANAPALRVLAARWGLGSAYTSTRMRLGPAVPWQPLALYSTFNLFWG